MKAWLAQLIKEILSALGWHLAGAERQRRKQQEAARDLEKQLEEIANRPDLPRDDLYERLRNRNRSVPPVPGPSDGSGGPDVRGE